MSEPRTLRHGAWPSPITADRVAQGGVRLWFPRLAGGATWWAEGRPDENGRGVVVRRDATGEVRDLLPSGWGARTRVHEYGGMAWLRTPSDGLVFARWEDQRLYRLDEGSGQPVPLTPTPAEPGSLRYADFVLAPDGASVWCVREAHEPDRVERAIVAVPLDGSGALDAAAVRVVVAGSDFVAYPRLSPAGDRIAWVAWDHPRMPWDGTELRVADLDAAGRPGEPRTLLGGGDESVLQPEWVDNDSLYVVSDRSGWWNLYRVAAAAPGVDPVPLCPRPEEFGDPLWTLGMTSYAVLPDGRLVVKHGTDTVALAVLDPATGELADLDLPYTYWQPSLAAEGGAVVGVAASPTEPLTVVRVDLATGRAEPLRAALTDRPDARYLTTPRSVTVPGPGERDVHAHVYPPANPDVTPPDGERPPYVVFVHGGPTAQASAVLDLEKAFFTSRGIGVVDVNYGGSTGYGRAYRERLRRQWGVVDVEDCVAAVRALVDEGEADGARVAIRGGSAGGWTTLGALTSTEVFACGTSYYGIGELLSFVADTHDFESRYLDGLIGSLPEDRDVYVDRAPLSHVDRLSCPVLLLQGLEDLVVPPSQAELFVAALERKGIPHAYLAFAGEQHGFRRAETVVTALEAELSFYGQVFGFVPPGVPVLPLSAGHRTDVEAADAEADAAAEADADADAAS